MEVVPDKGGATVKKRGVFRGGSRKRSPTAEAGMRLVRRRGLGGAGEEALVREEAEEEETDTQWQPAAWRPRPLQGRLVMGAGAGRCWGGGRPTAEETGAGNQGETCKERRETLLPEREGEISVHVKPFNKRGRVQ